MKTYGEVADKVVVWLKNGERQVYDTSYYDWEVSEGILVFEDANDRKRIVLYSMNNVHKVEILYD